MEGISEVLAAAVERAGRSVVRVEGRRGGAASGVALSADGVVVTAAHVVEEDEPEVGLPDGTRQTAAVAGRDAGTDLAVLRIRAALEPPAFSTAEGLEVGHLVLAVSRPGRSARASLGVVAALGPAGEPWRTPAGGRLDRYVQTDLALHPGFSGSALADSAGAIVGVNTSGLLRGAAMAVPAATVRRIADTLLAHGRVRRGFLGLGTYPVRLPGDLSAKAGQPAALLVVSVEAGSPAASAGLLLGDALLGLDGQPLTGPADLLPFVEEERIGTETAARILRAGDLREVRLTVGARP